MQAYRASILKEKITCFSCTFAFNSAELNFSLNNKCRMVHLLIEVPMKFKDSTEDKHSVFYYREIGSRVSIIQRF